MEDYSPDDWQHRLWASLSLELLARAALAAISPTLLADRGNWRNVYHALGHPPTAKRFGPVSIRVTEVLNILHELRPEFTKELLDSCIEECAYRNAELHSGEDAISGTGTSTWLPQYYASCQAFLASLGKALQDLFRDPKLAEQMIASLKDTAAKSVEKEIHVHKEKWGKTEQKQQTVLSGQAATWASRHAGHRAVCPACGSPALLRGSPQGSVSTDIGQDVVVQKQTMLPAAFECVACGLKISGLSKLAACGLGDAFVSTTTLSPAEFFGLYTEQDLDEACASAAEPEWEEDFNE
ncbi:MAG: hypothetical protein IT169_07175 [Bryobacterales bacterium]|nr:hypothetical protein [Bryobacterales bacterium]